MVRFYGVFLISLFFRYGLALKTGILLKPLVNVTTIYHNT